MTEQLPAAHFADPRAGAGPRPLNRGAVHRHRRVDVTPPGRVPTRLPFADGSVDAVLLLGPLYHLRDPADRSAALRSARRVLRRGGVLAAAGISRYLAVLEAGATGALDDALTGPLRTVIETGHYDGHLGFMPAHFHTAVELRGEVSSAGFSDVVVYGVEGPSWAALDVADGFESRCDAALRCARLVERDPLLINASAHLLAVGRR